MSLFGYNTVVLPGGYFDAGGVRHRNARLRSLTGADEEWIAAVPGEQAQATFVTELLRRVVRSVGPFRATRELVRDLFAGDREYLLLKLIETSFGGRVEMTLACLDPDCRADMDVSFEIGQVPVEAGEAAASYRLPGTNIVFRLPRGSDQEEIAGANLPAEEALRRLLELCILEPAGSPPGDEAAWSALAGEIERLSPRVDFELEAACPECGRTCSSRLDAASWFVGELSRRQANFEREIHLLGFYYHWPLAGMLRLSCERRNRWARLLERELDRSEAASYA